MSEPLMAGVTMKLQKRGLKSQRGRLQEVNVTITFIDLNSKLTEFIFSCSL